MSAMEMRKLESQVDLLSYAEKLSLMAYLVKLLQNQSEFDGFEGDSKARNGLDEAIAQVERGEVFYYDSVEEMFKDSKNA